LCAEKDPIFVVYPTIRHVDAGRRAHLRPFYSVDVVFTAEAIGAVELDARDENGGEVGGGCGL
jgi:hypothetical protein